MLSLLGIYFGHNHEICSRLNWEAKVMEVKEQLKRSEMRNLWEYNSH